MSDHDCRDADLDPIDHPVNSVDWDGPRSSQGYQAYRCRVCGDYWGVRHQYDPGTGADDRAYRFGSDFSTIRRHY